MARIRCFAQAAIDNNQEIVTNHTINNVQRSVGARLGGWIAERFGNYEVTPGLLQFTYRGIAGQSFGLCHPGHPVETDR